MTITSVTTSCSPSTPSAGTSACSANVQGTGNFNPDVIWSTSAGAISSSGVLTAPSVASPVVATVTAVSVQDGTKSGTATSNIIPPTITQLSPSVVSLDANTLIAGRITITLGVTGVIASDTLKITPSIPILGSQLVNANQIALTLGFDTPHQSDGEYAVQVCNPDGVACSNPMNLILVPNQNALTIAPSGSLLMLDLGTVSKFDATGTATGSFSIGSGIGGAVTIAADGSGNAVVGGTTHNSSGTLVGLVSDDGNGSFLGTAANGTTGCITRQNANLLSCFTTATMSAPLRSTASTGAEPWLVEILTLPVVSTPELDAVVFYRQSTELRRYSTVDMSMRGIALSTTGVTPKSQLAVGVGVWRLVVFRSGPAAQTGALLSEVEGLVIFFDVNSMKELRRVTLTGIPVVNMAADETHGTVIVAKADKKFVRVDVATGTQTPLVSQSPFPAMGLIVSPDGTKLFAARRGQLVVLSNQ